MGEKSYFVKRCKTTWNGRSSLEKSWLDLTRKIERIQNDIILMPCAQLPCCLGLFDRNELEPTLHSDVAHPAISICWHGKEFPEIVLRARISGWGKRDATCSAMIPALAYESRLLEVRPVSVYAYSPPAKAMPGMTAILSNASRHAETNPTTSPARNVAR